MGVCQSKVQADTQQPLSQSVSPLPPADQQQQKLEPQQQEQQHTVKNAEAKANAATPLAPASCTVTAARSHGSDRNTSRDSHSAWQTNAEADTDTATTAPTQGVTVKANAAVVTSAPPSTSPSSASRRHSSHNSHHQMRQPCTDEPDSKQAEPVHVTSSTPIIPLMRIADSPTPSTPVPKKRQSGVADITTLSPALPSILKPDSPMQQNATFLSPQAMHGSDDADANGNGASVGFIPDVCSGLLCPPAASTSSHSRAPSSFTRGCTHLRCISCDLNVISLCGRAWDLDRGACYVFVRTHHPHRSRLRAASVADPTATAYTCQCTFVTVRGESRTVDEVRAADDGKMIRWKCGGGHAAEKATTDKDEEEPDEDMSDADLTNGKDHLPQTAATINFDDDD